MLADNATLIIGTGNYFLAPVGTEPSANLRAPDSAWENIGHTSLEDILSITSEGGEAKVIGTLQAPALRQTYSQRHEKIRVVLQQFDEAALKLYWGRNAKRYEKDSRFLTVPSSPQATRAAFMAVYVDEDAIFALWAPSVEILRGDDFEIADTENLAGMPLDVTPMGYVPAGATVANDWGWALTPLEPLPLAESASAGTPGSFTPSTSAVPDNVSRLTSVTAKPASAWTTGQYVVLGDGSEAHWSGTAWAPGKAD